MTESRDRKTLMAADLNALSDSDFAYIDSNGDRHLPIPDAAHVQAALSRFGQTQFDNAADKAATAKKLLAAAKKFEINVGDDTDVSNAARSADPATKTCPLCNGTKKIRDGNVKCPECNGTGTIPVEQKSAQIPATPRKKIPMNKINTRSFNLSDVQVRSSDDGTKTHFSGYASTTDQPYDVQDFMGQYAETIRSGAFTKTLRDGGNVPLLFNHGGMPIASTSAGTMSLTEDRNGLKVDADLDRRQSLTNDICIALERRDLAQMSFSFQATRDKWSNQGQNRDVLEARLFDASIVTYPANPATTAELRAALAQTMGVEGTARWNEFLKGYEYSERQLRAAFEILNSVTDIEFREGKTISAATAEALQTALDALHAADDKLSEVQPILIQVNSSLDEGQKAIAETLSVNDPDGDPNDTGFEANGDDSKDTTAVKGSATGLANGGTGQGDSAISPPDGAGPRSNEPVTQKVVPASVLETRAMLKELQRA